MEYSYMKLTYNGTLFNLECNPAEYDLARKVGFFWNSQTKTWVTSFADTAAKIAYLLPPEMRWSIQTARERETQRIIDSQRIYPRDKRFSLWEPKGSQYLPFQRAGIEVMQGRKNILLADPMGLGKTIQAIGFFNSLKPNPKVSVLIVCPASLKLNWAREWRKWSAYSFNKIEVATSKKWNIEHINIINYDILAKYKDELTSRIWDLLILDEAHYLKNTKAQRTKVVFGFRNYKGIQAHNKIAMTGTPILNRPIELFPIIHYLAPGAFPNQWEFAKRYCKLFRGKWGWDMSGAENLEELQNRLRSTIMIRRNKEDVLPQLPKKIRQIIEIDPDNSSLKIVHQEKRIWEEVLQNAGIEMKDTLSDDEFKEVVKVLNSKGIYGNVAQIRHENALAKIPYVVEHLEDAIESCRKVVCFCHHKDVVKELSEKFGDRAVVLVGDTPMRQRQEAVDRFQSDSKINLFIGNIQAAGVGITLTASAHVVFAELSWVPGEVSQAEDRCHRIGQSDSVLVQHLVLSGSIDAHMAKTIVHKQELIDQAVNKQTFTQTFKEMLQ